MIWIAIKGRNHQEGRPAFYAATEADLISAIRRRGFVPTHWAALFENDSEWIRVESIPSAEEAQ